MPFTFWFIRLTFLRRSTLKFYDASEGEIYDAVPTLSTEFGTADLGFSNNEFYYLDACCLVHYLIQLNE